MLPRIADSLSFLYLENVRIVQDDTGVCAQVVNKDGTDRVYVPTAALATILLGPGTSITQPALATIARHGTTVVCVGSGVVRSYATIQPSSLTTDWLERQVHTWTDDSRRLAVAVDMYQRRFPTDVPDGVTLAQLRGLEGQRVKALYRLLAQKHNIARFRRNYDPDNWNDQDPVNLALSSANTALYGAVHAAISALGCSPALGFVHNGTQLAFVYDIADLYKAQVTIPLAFSLHASAQPDRDARRAMRDQFRLFRLMPRMVKDICSLLGGETADDGQEEDRTPDVVHLWDPVTGSVPAGVNYGNDDAINLGEYPRPSDDQAD